MKKQTLWVTVITLGAAALCGSGWFGLRYGSSGFSALEKPSALEEFGARMARGAAMPRLARNLPNPVLNTPEVIADSRAHWADHCAVCHGNDGSGETEMGSHMYPRAPDMREQQTQQLTDGELYFIIENGIRLSGMPGWHTPGKEGDSWKLVHFIRHLKKLSPEELAEMEKLNPKGPEDRQEEQQEQQFLNGGQPSAAKPPIHH
jgi:mono/diheme cytochrome c family protein